MQSVIPKSITCTMSYDQIPIFTYKIDYPYLSSTYSPRITEQINKYYADAALCTEKYCRTELYPTAEESLKYSQPDLPFNTYTLDHVYQVTYSQDGIVSIYMDTYTYMGGAHGTTKRTSDTWNLKTGAKLHLNRSCYPEILNSIEQQITVRQEEEPGSYFDDYKILLRKTFDPQSFYLQPGGIVVYYQQYDIAPYSTGLPEFYLPGISRWVFP